MSFTTAHHAPLVIDVAGLQLTEVDRQRLRHPLVGGLILFGRNWQNRDQLTRLCADIKATRPDVLIAVDHEGGRVQRFKTDGFTPIAPMRRLGEVWSGVGVKGKHDAAALALKAMDAASACGYVMGAELRACGVDLTFAPVLDLDWGGSSVIGERAFSPDARTTSLLAKSVMHGLLMAGMHNCGKHFPGHGFVKGDSHHEIPVDKRSLKAILADDAAPYAWLSQSLTSVMPAHVIYPKVDSRPAGFSKVWLQGILRERLRFTGCVFSDDLSMEAARLIDGQRVSYTQAATTALNAGCDMVLLCNQSVDDGSAIDELFSGMEVALRTGVWQQNPSSESRRAALLPHSSLLDWDSLMVSERYQAALELIP
jgi:beta-N-acetylhexosaminidase